jgi:hypothetical protein
VAVESLRFYFIIITIIIVKQQELKMEARDGHLWRLGMDRGLLILSLVVYKQYGSFIIGPVRRKENGSSFSFFISSYIMYHKHIIGLLFYFIRIGRLVFTFHGCFFL